MQVLGRSGGLRTTIVIIMLFPHVQKKHCDKEFGPVSGGQILLILEELELELESSMNRLVSSNPRSTHSSITMVTHAVHLVRRRLCSDSQIETVY